LKRGTSHLTLKNLSEPSVPPRCKGTIRSRPHHTEKATAVQDPTSQRSRPVTTGPAVAAQDPATLAAPFGVQRLRPPDEGNGDTTTKTICKYTFLFPLGADQKITRFYKESKVTVATDPPRKIHL